MAIGPSIMSLSPYASRRYLVGLLLALAGGWALAGDTAELPEPEPLLDPPAKGKVQAVLTPSEQVQSVHLVDRATGKTFPPASWDKQTGQVRFEQLPGGGSYDLVIRTPQGRSIEGIDLSFADSRLLRLAEKGRKLRGLEPLPAHPFSREDAREISQFATKQEDFMDWSRTLYVRGHGDLATALVERMRTRAFYAGAGQVIWRIELWYFQWQGGQWVRLPNQAVVLRRERTRPAKWQEIDVSYHPELSVFVDEKGKSSPLKFTLPAKTDPRRGRPAGSEPKLDQEPRVSGLEEENPDQEAPRQDPAGL
jgi:hypothetical protein